jgi:hypothetical protein
VDEQNSHGNLTMLEAGSEVDPRGVALKTHPDRGLTAAAVIISYLRPDILRTTLETWLASHRLPDQFLVVDASPDAASRRAPILRDFHELFRARGSDYLITGEPSTTAQRNKALDKVWTDIVMFLDDESRPEPTYVDRIMEAFELDAGGLIGGVGGSERDEITFRARVKETIRAGSKVAARSFPMSRRQAFPPGVRLAPPVRHLPLRRVRQLYGSRMSFRTQLAAVNRFDERILRYGLCEDLDISIRVGRTHALVQRTDAFVEHDEAQVGRIPSIARFLIGWTNPAYITEKHFPEPANRRPLDRLLALARARAALPFLLRRDNAGRQAVLERFTVAAAMVAFVREGNSAALGDRFTALQQWIFRDVPDKELVRLESYRRWEQQARLRLDKPDQDQEIEAGGR